jgi:ferritin
MLQLANLQNLMKGTEDLNTENPPVVEPVVEPTPVADVVPVTEVPVVEPPVEQPVVVVETGMSSFISASMRQLLVAQIGHELTAAHAYEAMALQLECKSYEGIAKWCKDQATGERMHAHKVIQYLVDQDINPGMPAIAAHQCLCIHPKEVVQAILQQEKLVTAQWKAIFAQALQDADASTMALAQWFVIEQIEEEGSCIKLLDKLGQSKAEAGIIELDEQVEETVK